MTSKEWVKNELSLSDDCLTTTDIIMLNKVLEDLELLETLEKENLQLRKQNKFNEDSYFSEMIKSRKKGEEIVELSQELFALKEENQILKDGIESLLNYCDELYLYEEEPYRITEEGIMSHFFDYEKEDLEKIKLAMEKLENGN